MNCHRAVNLLVCGVGACLAPTIAHAHYMTTPYVLPVPFWLYVYSCAATLVLTFAILGYFVNSATASPTLVVHELRPNKLWAVIGRRMLSLLRAGALACLLLTIVAGLIGTLDSTRNINMKLFWVVFLLAFTYVTAFIGDLFELINPWRTLADWIEKLGGPFKAHLKYPAWLGYYPAFVFYVVLIWIELFVPPNPSVIAKALLVYSVITLVGAALFGAPAWFRYAEFFAVFFRQIGSLAPVQYMPSADRHAWRIRLRPPFVGAFAERPDHFGLILFILFMLASTSYDAIHDTETWITFYWKFLIVLAQPLWGTDINASQNLLMDWYFVYLRAGLLLSPFVYLLLYLAVIAVMKKLTKSTLTVRALALDFVASLIPIAFVYNMCHYYTMLLSEAQMLPVVSTDPFGFGWNLFGIEMPLPWYLDMSVIWHTQVGLILVGHVASVYLGHMTALRVFASRKRVVLSQIPLLLLMVAYTAIGLYILSLPLAVSVLRD